MYSRVYVEITNICNMRCSFCHGHSRQPRTMTALEFAHILEQLEGKTQYVYYHLMGEPLTHPSLPDFIREANGRGFKSVVTTNGTLLARRGRELIDAGVYKVSISLHSFEDGSEYELHRYLRQISDFAKAASARGIIVVLRLWNRGHDGGKNDGIYSFLRENIPCEWVENTRGVRIHDKLHLEWGDRFEWPDMSADDHGSEVFCYGLRDHFGILCDGSVVPCCLDPEGAITLGNIFTEELDAILSSPRATAMVKGFEARCASEELCRRCGYARRFS
jgi:MoaA/NifB/PqqE/SkfB family radical SAM enzyme